MKVLKIVTLSTLYILLFAVGAGAQDKALKEPVNTVINNYVALKNELITADGDAAEIKAKALLNSVGAIPKAGLSTDVTDLVAKLEFDSRHISEVNKVPHQREHFASLSNNLYTLVKKLRINNTVLYRQYCTMTKNYFLSESDKGRDPYMGMANCTKVTETLPAFR